MNVVLEYGDETIAKLKDISFNYGQKVKCDGVQYKVVDIEVKIEKSVVVETIIFLEKI